MESTHPPAAQPLHRIAPRTYLIIFVWLAVFTVLEVLIASALPDSAKVGPLVIIAIVKAALVVLFYMHLRYDSKWYWLILLTPIGFVLLLARYLLPRFVAPGP
jgi:cytochrome c oxidase subunit 4